MIHDALEVKRQSRGRSLAILRASPFYLATMRIERVDLPTAETTDATCLAVHFFRPTRLRTSVRMRDEHTYTRAEPVRVAAAVTELDLPMFSEVMNALPDPADPGQAMLASVPVLVDEMNYGDIVRLGPENEDGIRPILEVVVASGHVHMLAAAEDDGAADLIAELERMFPAYALRIARASASVVSVSVHPDLDADDVAGVIEDWLGDDVDNPEEGLAIGPPCETALGPVAA